MKSYRVLVVSIDTHPIMCSVWRSRVHCRVLQAGGKSLNHCLRGDSSLVNRATYSSHLYRVGGFGVA